METHRTIDINSFLTIPSPPRRAQPPEQRSRGWNALREACLVGMLALAASWTLAELASALGGF